MIPELLPHPFHDRAKIIFDELEAEARRQLGGFMFCELGAWKFRREWVLKHLVFVCNQAGFDQPAAAVMEERVRKFLVGISNLRLPPEAPPRPAGRTTVNRGEVELSPDFAPFELEHVATVTVEPREANDLPHYSPSPSANDFELRELRRLTR